MEAALNVYLESFATTLGSREQLAIAEVASALLVIPKTLSVNAAKDATELVAKLIAYHYASQVGFPVDCQRCGIWLLHLVYAVVDFCCRTICGKCTASGVL